LAIIAGTTAGALVLRARALVWAGMAIATGQVVYVFVGLRVADAPPAVFRALATAPALVAHKLGVVARIGRGRGADSWVRTPRQASSPGATRPVS
jgi:hypothetical protein